MSRRYADPVEVRGDTGRPTAFLWKGRVYLVREVLARWVEAGAWWRSVADQPTARAVFGDGGRPTPGHGSLGDRAGSAVGGGEPGEPVGAGLHATGAGTAQRHGIGRSSDVAGIDPAGDAAVSDMEGVVAVGDREVWRVEAAAGRSAPVGVYDLARHGDVWRLARALD